MENLLEVKDLRVSFNIYGRCYCAVEGVNFCLKDHETLVLAGESGSGKSITALSLTKILPPQADIISGEVIFRDQDLLKLSDSALVKIRGRDIAYIFQEPSSFLNPVYSIGNQITEAIVFHQQKTKTQAKEIAMGLLCDVLIPDPERVFFAYPHQLSGGMNQRAFMAMSLACNPKLLIADEPTTALDVAIESQILKLLVELKNRHGFSLLFITHNLSIAARIADRICIMHQGKIVEEGSKDQILNAPEHFHTRELVLAYEKIGKL